MRGAPPFEILVTLTHSRLRAPNTRMGSHATPLPDLILDGKTAQKGGVRGGGQLKEGRFAVGMRVATTAGDPWHAIPCDRRCNSYGHSSPRGSLPSRLQLLPIHHSQSIKGYCRSEDVVSCLRRAHVNSRRRRAHLGRESAVAAIAGSVSTAALWNTAVFVLGNAVLRSGLTWAAILTSWFLGSACLAAFGWQGYVLLCTYFVVGTLVTKLGRKRKEMEGTYERNAGKRTVGSVWGSGFAALVCATLTLVMGDVGNAQGALTAGFVASLASKLSDTVASEVGKAYGRTTYLITSFERVSRGTDGAVSMEGTIAGLASSVGYVWIAHVSGLLTPKAATTCVVAAFAANTIESVLGATVQNMDWVTNDAVNVAQITIAALIAIAATACFGL